MGNRGKWHVRHGARPSVRRAPELERVRANPVSEMRPEYDFTAARPNPYVTSEHVLVSSEPVDNETVQRLRRLQASPAPKAAWWRRLLDWFWT